MALFSILSREHRIFLSVSLCYFCIRYFNGVCTRLYSLWTISLVFVLKSFSSFYHLTMISNRLLIWPYGKWFFSKQNFVSHLTDTIKKIHSQLANEFWSALVWEHLIFSIQTIRLMVIRLSVVLDYGFLRIYFSRWKKNYTL